MYYINYTLWITSVAYSLKCPWNIMCIAAIMDCMIAACMGAQKQQVTLYGAFEGICATDFIVFAFACEGGRRVYRV